MTAAASLAALRDPARSHARALAGVVVAHALQTPIVELLPAEDLSARIRAELAEAAASPRLREALREAVAAARSRAAADERALRELLLPGAEPVARELLGLPWSPSEEIVLRVINQPELRELLASVLSDSLHGFADRLRTADKGMLGGIGERAARRGSGLFGALASGIGEAAGGIVGAVRDELGAAMEGRVRDFVGTATEQGMRSIAAWLADPQHAERTARMRTGILDVALAMTVREVGAEADKLDVEAITDRLLAALRDAAADPAAEAHVTRAAEEALGLLPDPTLGELAARLGLDAALRELAAAWLTPHLDALIASDPFAAWWSAVHAEETA